MKLKDHLREIESVQNKGLVYKELRSYLDKFIKTDTRDADQVIPIGAPILADEDLTFEKVVPQVSIADVILEIEAAIEQIEIEYKKLIDKEIK